MLEALRKFASPFRKLLCPQICFEFHFESNFGDWALPIVRNDVFCGVRSLVFILIDKVSLDLVIKGEEFPRCALPSSASVDLVLDSCILA